MQEKSVQLKLDIHREPEADRNRGSGGRSFYFFDFDDNIAFLTTPIVLFHKSTGVELAVSSGEFAHKGSSVGVRGEYRDYELRLDDKTGSFRGFRDRDFSFLQKILGCRQAFVSDIRKILSGNDLHWKGPSWECFYHAVFNHRPLSVITARGHAPETIRQGIVELVRHSHLPHEPNYLSIYPVSHPETRNFLGDSQQAGAVADLKKKAIRASVNRAFEKYGYSPHHRFGMSDDDPKNLELIMEAMTSLKSDFPEVSFFVIDTSAGQLIKREIFLGSVREQALGPGEQLHLFS